MLKFTKLKRVMSFILLGIALAACGHHDENTVKVGTIAGPETELMQVAKKVAQQQGINIEIIEFSDYIMPNTALNDGSINANMFQHQPYLEQTIKDRGYKLAAIGKTFIYPMGAYSSKYRDLTQLHPGATIAIPNDPSNGARALLLLAKTGLITLKPGVNVNATPKDIIKNPQGFKIVELDAAQLPRALADVDLAFINTNYAIPAGLTPNSDALIKEDADSLYANIVAVREADKDNPKLKILVEALHSPEVKQTAERLFHKQAIPAWEQSK